MYGETAAVAAAAAAAAKVAAAAAAAAAKVAAVKVAAAKVAAVVYMLFFDVINSFILIFGYWAFGVRSLAKK